MTRTRVQSGGTVSGTYTRFGAVYTQSAVPSLSACTDEVSLSDGLPLYVEHYRTSGGLLTAKGDPGWFGRYPVNWPVTALTMQRLRGHAPIPSPSDVDLATQTLAGTNPSQPEVSLPVFIAELRDLPHMLHLQGRDILQKAGSANLLYRFGWKPLLSDLNLLLYFTELTNKRLDLLHRLKDKGLKRRVQLGTYTGLNYQNMVVESFAYFINRPYVTTSVQKCWGFVKYFPLSSFPTSEAELLALARKSAFGLDFSLAGNLSDLWELLPWSWFIDYMSNIGDYLAAHRNIVPMGHSTPLIMRHTISEWSDVGPAWTDPDMDYTLLNGVYETKSRSLASPSLSAHLPFLNDGQVSILGSLAVNIGNRSRLNGIR